MRKIISKEQKELKERKLKIIWGIFLGVILLLSTIGFAFNSADFSSQDENIETRDYNGVEFQKNQYGLWQFDLNGIGFATNFYPTETKNISSILTKNINNFANQPLYFGINSKDDIEQLAINEINYNLNSFILRSSFACLNANCSEDYPIKNCTSNNLIIFNEDNQGITRIREEKGCIIVYYKSGELLLAVDRFLFGILGIQ